MMRRDEPANVMHLIKPLMLMIGLVIALLAAELASADTVRVHDVAGSGGPKVTLSQVAELTGQYAQTLGGVVVGEFASEDRTLELKLEAVRRALRDSGAAVGRLNLQGYAVCTVHRVSDPEAKGQGDERRSGSAGSSSRTDAGPTDNEPPVANYERQESTEREGITLNTPMTVRRLILEELANALGIDASDLDVEFNDRDAELLGRSAVAGRHTVEPVVQPKLGSMSFRVRRFRGTEQVRQSTVTVNVRQRVLAVVATGKIHRGELIHRGSLAVREVLIDERSGVPIADPALVINQIASRTVDAGELVTPAGVEAPVAVRRRESVEVTLKQGALRITFTGIAKGQAAVGEMVEVENPKTRETFNATVIGRRQVTVGQIEVDKGETDAE